MKIFIRMLLLVSLICLGCAGQTPPPEAPVSEPEPTTQVEPEPAMDEAPAETPMEEGDYEE